MLGLQNHIGQKTPTAWMQRQLVELQPLRQHRNPQPLRQGRNLQPLTQEWYLRVMGQDTNSFGCLDVCGRCSR